MKSFRRSIKAVSPVIATIIIVAIAIVMSIAVAYWLLGLGSSFTKYEKVEFTAAYVTGNEASGFIVHMDLKNTGSAAATIDPAYIQYNGKPGTAYALGDVPVITAFNGGVAKTLEPGQSVTNAQITLPAPGAGAWKSGMTVELLLHTSAGKDYPKVVTLP
ncbi:MAG TPA: archaellin/type IV pilin N-terminal domain-containing protein [Candidatus Bathyarchaeia archaeon]|nr:archaellin/type IV pilin N-terminal domain-containing protein [Candidatus Bathyarchaeia archaeon]